MYTQAHSTVQPKQGLEPLYPGVPIETCASCGGPATSQELDRKGRCGTCSPSREMALPPDLQGLHDLDSPWGDQSEEALPPTLFRWVDGRAVIQPLQAVLVA